MQCQFYVGDSKLVEQQCEKHIILKPKPVAYRLGNDGTWLYGVPDEIQVSVNCPKTKNVTQYVLKCHGIIKIPDTCIGSGPNFELPQHFQGRDGLITTLTPKLATVTNYDIMTGEELHILDQVYTLSRSNKKILADTQHLGPIEYVPFKKFKAHYLEESDKYWRSPNDGFSWLMIAWAIAIVLILVGLRIRHKCRIFQNFDVGKE